MAAHAAAQPSERSVPPPRRVVADAARASRELGHRLSPTPPVRFGHRLHRRGAGEAALPQLRHRHERPTRRGRVAPPGAHVTDQSLHPLGRRARAERIDRGPQEPPPRGAAQPEAPDHGVAGAHPAEHDLDRARDPRGRHALGQALGDLVAQPLHGQLFLTGRLERGVEPRPDARQPRVRLDLPGRLRGRRRGSGEDERDHGETASEAGHCKRPTREGT
ncbi:MAG TPA: hypothetical protein DEF51_56465 [Myxococcales bacterium]|nr:hypothetical protein [Myxococcales bacterium]